MLTVHQHSYCQDVLLHSKAADVIVFLLLDLNKLMENLVFSLVSLQI